MISVIFMKQKNKMFTHLYYKITIISDEQNSIIEVIFYFIQSIFVKKIVFPKINLNDCY